MVKNWAQPIRMFKNKRSIILCWNYIYRIGSSDQCYKNGHRSINVGSKASKHKTCEEFLFLSMYLMLWLGLTLIKALSKWSQYDDKFDEKCKHTLHKEHTKHNINTYLTQGGLGIKIRGPLWPQLIKLN